MSPARPRTTDFGAPAASPLAIVTVPLLAGAGAAAAGVGIWVLLWAWLGFPYIATLLIGLLVGSVMRMLEPGFGPGAILLPVAAALFAAAASAIGFLVVDQTLIPWVDATTREPVQPSLADSATRLGRDLAAWLFIAFGAYLAHYLVRRST